jgi:hypothetical protein
MNEQILSRAEIAQDADAAAQRFVLTGVEQDCPFVSGTEASREWRREYQLGLLKWSAQGVSA